MSSLKLVLFLFVSVVLEYGWTLRTWKSDVSFNNPHNWYPGRLPCPADRMIFRASDPLVLQVPEGQTSVREMVLADYLELVLPENGDITLTGAKQSANCHGQDVVFRHTQPLRWTDPDNWDGWNKATPDEERVPCTHEGVRFNPGTTFNVVTPPSLVLGSLEINGVMMDPVDWYEQSSNGDNSLLLHKPDGDVPSLELGGSTCQPNLWCSCGNEYLHTEVCKAACPLALCNQPVKPAGFCCPFCGAYFLLKSKDEENVQLSTIINTFLKDKSVIWHASKVGQFVQVVLANEGEYSGDISSIADDLKIAIEKSNLGWSVAQLHASGYVWYPVSFWQVVGHFLSFFIFAALTISAIMVFYSKNWSWLQFSSPGGGPFVFARFENQTGELLVAHERRESSPSPPQAFDNPMYGATRKEQRNITVENPIYSELEDAQTSETCIAEEVDILDPAEFQKA